MATPKVSNEDACPVSLDPSRFDPDWYLLAYPEVRELVSAGTYGNPEEHFQRVGAGRGYDPNLLYSEKAYLELNPEVRDAVAAGAYPSGFFHFAANGHQEGRGFHSLWIHDDWYFGTYPQAVQEVEEGDFPTAQDHYLYRGARLGHSPHAVFDEAWYRGRYPDVATDVARGRYLSGYQHFIEHGLDERRQPHPRFDDQHYRYLNPDIGDAIEAGQVPGAWLHLVHVGLDEQRRWKTATRKPALKTAATALAACRLEELLATGRRLVFETQERPRISVVLVLFNRAELTLRCLESLRASLGISFELVIVDNLSTDATRRLLRRVRGAKVLLNDANEGFIRGANQAAAAARGELLLFLNNDAEVFPESLAAAAARLDIHPGAGAVGARVLRLDGKLEEAGSIVWRNGTTEGYGLGDDPGNGNYLFPRPVDYCSGVFLMTRRELFERLGGFNLAFAPAYYEEADYCFRLRREGFSTIYEPGAVVIHYGSASLPGDTQPFKELARNRPFFRERHAEALARRLPAAPEHRLCAAVPGDFRGRLLYLDDFIPQDHLGSGFPRVREILHALTDLGYFVTFFAANPVPVDWGPVRRDLCERGIEVIGHRKREEVAELVAERPKTYDAAIISRPHNLKVLLDEGIDLASLAPRVIYDAEAVAAQRVAQRRELLGEDRREEIELGLEEEIELASRAGEVWTVSESEAKLLGSGGARISVVSHAVDAEHGDRPFESRVGLLFVGRLVEPWNPNVDGLRWFLTETLPRLRQALDEAVPVTVVGRLGEDVDLPHPEGVEFRGRVEELAPLYNTHRLFFAPSRFAAGIPLKIVEAAAHGLPVVATELLADQLGWRSEVELMAGGNNDPNAFATAAARLYQDQAIWQEVRSAAIARTQQSYSREALRRALREALA